MTATLQTHADALRPEHAQADEVQQEELFAAIASAHASETDERRRPQAILDAICEAIGATTAHLSISLGSDERLLRAHGTVGDAWDQTARAAALEVHADATPRARIYGRSKQHPELVLLAAPLAVGGHGPFGGIAVVRSLESVGDADRLLLLLRAAAAHASLALTTVAPTRHPGAELEDFARVFARAPEYSSTHEFAYAVTNALRTRLDCEQTALGLVKRGRIKVICISGLDHVKQRSPGAHRIEQAMGETADAATPLVAQSNDQWGDSGSTPDAALHKQWRADAAGASVATIPLMSGETVVAVLALRRSEDRPFSQDDLAAGARLVTPLAAALPLIAEATRSLRSRAARQVRHTLHWATRAGSWGRKAMLLLALAFGVWFAAGSSTYRVTSPATVIAMREHAIATPFAGMIAEVMVRPGDRVERAQPIARMDTRDMEFERRETLAQLQQLDRRLKDATAQRDMATASQVAAERVVLESRLATLDNRLAQAVMLSPSAGVVVGSETRQLAGAHVSAGEPLFVIADESSMIIELRVPEGRMTHVKPGAPIRFASNARPELSGASAIDRIAPTADDDGRARAFSAHAAIPPGQPWLRPGMEGVAQIDGGTRRNWWIALHGVLDTARLRFWID